MAFWGVPCFDVMELVGKRVVEQRQEIHAGFWKHNGSNWRLVNNQINNIVLTLEKRGKHITPTQAHPKKQYKYVAKATALHHGSGCLINPTKGMHVGRPTWGTSIWTYYSASRCATAEYYIVDKTIECAHNPRLTWAHPPRYACYTTWAAHYTYPTS